MPLRLNIRNFLKRFVVVAVLLFVFFVIGFKASAQPDSLEREAFEQLTAAGVGGNFDAPIDPRVIVANIIRIALTLLGTILVVLIVYAGFLWMTAAGEADKIEKAKKILYNSVIGMVIILAAYSITTFVVRVALQIPNCDSFTVWGGSLCY